MISIHVNLRNEEIEDDTSEPLAMRQVTFLLTMFSFGESKSDVGLEVVAIAATSRELSPSSSPSLVEEYSS
jgi:hypothetical protein